MRIEEVEDPGRGAGRAQMAATFDREQFYVVTVRTVAVTHADDVGRDAVVKSMTDPDCTLKSFSLSDEKAHRLAPNVIMLTYVATQDGTCGKETLVPKIRSTAIYVQENGEWLERYYQETPAK